jgi:hypothetical protein
MGDMERGAISSCPDLVPTKSDSQFMLSLTQIPSSLPVHAGSSDECRCGDGSSSGGSTRPVFGSVVSREVGRWFQLVFSGALLKRVGIYTPPKREKNENQGENEKRKK